MADNTNDTSTIFWKKEINMGQALSIVIPLITTFMLSIWDMKSDLIKNDMRITSLEKGQESIVKSIQDGQLKNEKQTEVTNDRLQQILIKLENKKDR